MSVFELKIELKQQTPYIHFQHDQYGATLRASEVKPKLDKFLIEKLGGKNKIDNSWFIKDKESLDYKMRFIATGTHDISRAGDLLCESISIQDRNERKRKEKESQREINGSYFGNMVNGTSRYYSGRELKSKQKEIKDSFKETVFYSDPIRMTFVCFKKDLLKAIQDYIVDFFLVNNFGCRQSKGFGGFIVSKIMGTVVEYSESMIGKILCSNYGSQKCYVFSGKSNSSLERIRIVYAIMKSGINLNFMSKGYRRSLLFVYMHNFFQIGNEKAYLKSENIVPIGETHHEYHANGTNHSPHYVRALLGVGDALSFEKSTFKVSIDGVRFPNDINHIENIYRFPSTIFFKVVNDEVYYVGKRIKKIFGKSFVFTSSLGKRKLSVPENNDKIDENFMDGFLDYCLGELNNPNPENNGTPTTVFIGDSNFKVREAIIDDGKHE